MMMANYDFTDINMNAMQISACLKETDLAEVI